MADLTSSTLANFGLGDLGSLVDDFIRSGRSWDEFNLGLYDPTTQQGKVVAQKYPELQGLIKNGHAPMSIADVVNYKDQAKQLLRQYGIPEGFYDSPEELSSLITNGVSLSELNTRVQQGFVAASSAPTEVRQAMKDFYGVDEGHLAAYFLDPAKATPILEQQFATAKIAGTAARTGFEGLTQQTAEQLAAQGVTDGQAQQGFNQLAAQSELFNPLPGEAQGGISTEDQVGATFSGNANAQRRIAQKQAGRLAQFQGGGGFATSKDGFGGIGTAQ